MKNLARYFETLKPGIASLSVVSTIAGMMCASSGSHYSASTIFFVLFFTLLGSFGAGALNMWYDSDIDNLMSRTRKRGIPSGDLNKNIVLFMGLMLSSVAVLGMLSTINAISSILLLSTILCYVVIYTVFLKRRTPHSVEIGGITGCIPPLIGSAAIDGSISFASCIVAAIIFAWNPPHFWSLALARTEEYAKAGIPVLPVTHGKLVTKIYIFMYTLILLPISLVPYFVHSASLIYAIVAAILNFTFLYHSLRLFKSEEFSFATFKYSIMYLFFLLLATILDRCVFYL